MDHLQPITKMRNFFHTNMLCKTEEEFATFEIRLYTASLQY